MMGRNFRLGAAAAAMFVAAGVASCTAAPPPPSASPRAVSALGPVSGLPEAALETMNQPQFASGRWLISVQDIDSGEVLINLDSDKMAEPGSFAKTYSTGAAWLKWGPDHQITTPVKHTGSVTDGVLSGDLVLVGKGDLTMGGRTKPDGTVDVTHLDHNDANPLPGATLTSEDPLTGLNNLAAQVKASGVNSVSGQVLVDDRLFQGTLGGEPITPIIINQNLIDILVTPGAVGEPARVEMRPAVAPWHVTADIKTVAAGDETNITDPKGSSDGEIVVSGTIAADSSPALKVYALEDPATFARTAFVEALGRAGVTVGGDPLAPNTTSSLPDQAAVDALPSVAGLKSLPLSQEATYVMKISYNRGAQTFVCLLAVEAGEDDCSAGLGVAGKLWADAGLTTTDASLIDGSGLPGNVVTPANAVQAQMIMAKRPDAEQWKATLPILGVDGSLADVQAQSPAAGKVFAKTGSLVAGDSFNGRIRLETKALGGVMKTEKGRNLAFGIFVNQGFYAGIEGVFQANDDVGKVAAAIQQAY